MYVISLVHYLEEQGVQVTIAPFARHAQFYGSIAAAASQYPPGVAVDTALRCRRRPGRRPYPGHLRVRGGAEGPIERRCTSCDDCGVVHPWEGTPWDFSRFRPRDALDDRGLLILLSEDECAALRKILVVDEHVDALLHRAVASHFGVALRGTPEEIEDLAAFAAAEENEARDTRRRALLAGAYGKVTAALDGGGAGGAGG